MMVRKTKQVGFEPVFARIRETGFTFDKSIARNRKILNWFEIGLANTLRLNFYV